MNDNDVPPARYARDHLPGTAARSEHRPSTLELRRLLRCLQFTSKLLSASDALDWSAIENREKSRGRLSGKDRGSAEVPPIPPRVV